MAAIKADVAYPLTLVWALAGVAAAHRGLAPVEGAAVAGIAVSLAAAALAAFRIVKARRGA